jgi:hypothetical protein
MFLCDQGLAESSLFWSLSYFAYVLCAKLRLVNYEEEVIAGQQCNVLVP